MKSGLSDDQRLSVHSFLASYMLASFAAGFLLTVHPMLTSTEVQGLGVNAVAWLLTLVVYVCTAACFSFLVGMFAVTPAIPLILALRFAGLTGPVPHALAGVCAAIAADGVLNALLGFHRGLSIEWPLISAGAAAGLVYWYGFEKIYATLARRELDRSHH